MTENSEECGSRNEIFDNSSSMIYRFDKFLFQIKIIKKLFNLLLGSINIKEFCFILIYSELIHQAFFRSANKVYI